VLFEGGRSLREKRRGAITTGRREGRVSKGELRTLNALKSRGNGVLGEGGKESDSLTQPVKDDSAKFPDLRTEGKALDRGAG